MSYSVVLLISSSFLVLMSVTLLLVFLLCRIVLKQLSLKDQQIQNLLNRVTSQDFPTYSMMSKIPATSQTSTISDMQPVMSMSDMAEAQRYNQLHGVGESVFDEAEHDDLNDMLSDIGLGGDKE